MRPALAFLSPLVLALPLGAQIPNTPAPGEPAESGYSGPALPSRGGAASVTHDGELMRLRPFVAITGLYDSGLTETAVGVDGKPVTSSGAGLEGTAGLLGFHTWKHTMLGIDYRLSGRYYGNQNGYNGVDNALTLMVDHELSPRWRLTAGESLASYSQNYFVPYSTGWSGISDFAPAETSQLAGHDLFDERTTAFTSSARATYLFSARTSASFGGTGFTVRRASDGPAIGVNGYLASGDMAYRVNRYQTIGADYSFNHYDFQGSFGSTDAHGVSFDYAARFGRQWEFRLRAGGYKVETLRLQRVSIDPTIAQIIGRDFGIETYHRTLYMPSGEASLTRAFRRSTLGVSYARVLTPGNGVLLTSMWEGASGYLTCRLSERATANISGGAGRFSSLGETIGKYSDYGAGGGLTYSVARGFSVIARIDARNYEVGGTTFRRDSYRATFGIAWSPGDVPLSLW